MSELKSLFTNDESIDVLQKIVDELLNENNLDRKTELENPISFAIMDVIDQQLELAKLDLSSNVIKRFTNTVFRYQISHNREGRKEYIASLNAIANMRKNEILDQNQQQKLLQ